MCASCKWGSLWWCRRLPTDSDCSLSAQQFMPRGTTTPTFVNMGSMPQMGAGTLPATVSRYVRTCVLKGIEASSLI